jgi:hypothetical protein
MIQCAFTGTRRGMTAAQWAKFLDVLAGLAPQWFHHGDCVGADAQAHSAAVRVCEIHIHPCTIAAKRAWCAGAHLMSIPLPPLDRNKMMVDDCEALIATPRLMVEELRSGTWSTIRYARKCRKPVHIIWPDGSYIAPPPK